MIELDPVDLKILALLQKDSTLSTSEVAEKVGLSQSPCWRRIKRFWDEGIIAGEVCLLDRKRIGLGVTVFATVTLTAHSEENAAAFESIIKESKEILGCYSVTGNRDYLLRIVVKDIEAYDRYISDHFLRLPFVQSVNSRFALRCLKETTELPIHATV